MKISDLVNKVEPFRFEFDGLALEGTYCKWKTTTPNYLTSVFNSIPQETDGGTEEEKEANKKVRDEAVLNASLKVIADTIVTWNAEDDNGNPLPVSLDTFKQLPNQFTEKFTAFIGELREGNPMNGNGSPTG